MDHDEEVDQDMTGHEQEGQPLPTDSVGRARGRQCAWACSVFLLAPIGDSRERGLEDPFGGQTGWRRILLTSPVLDLILPFQFMIVHWYLPRLCWTDPSFLLYIRVPPWYFWSSMVGTHFRRQCPLGQKKIAMLTHDLGFHEVVHEDERSEWAAW